MSKIERELERQIVAKVVMDLLSNGFVLHYYCEDQDENINVLNASDKSLAGLFDYDEQILYASRSDCTGWVRFIYGGDGWDVINDYSVNLDKYLAEANAFAELYS